MQPGFICVAGIDAKSSTHVRPVLAGRLRPNLLARHGGPFDIGHVVDLGSTTYAGSPPEVEDYRFDPGRAISTQLTSPNQFWDLLRRVCTHTFRDIFGPDMTQR